MAMPRSLLWSASALLGLAPVSAQSGTFFAQATPVRFGTPTGSAVQDLTLNRDETIAVFASNRPGSRGLDLWTASRPLAGAPWGPARVLTNVNSGADDDGPALSANGLELYFSSGRSSARGPRSIFVSRRNSLAAPWSTPVLVNEVSPSGVAVRDPQLTDDGLTMFFAAASSGQSDIHSARRSNRRSPWGQVQPVPNINDPAADDDGPAPEAGGSILWFSSRRAGGSGGADLYVAWRDGNTGVWSQPLAIAERNTAADETSPFIAAASSLTYHNQPSGILSPTEITCICRQGSDVRTLGADDGWMRAEQNPLWPQPQLFVTGQRWRIGSTEILSFYNWQIGGPANVWLTALSTARAPSSIALPSIGLGALELSPLTFAPIAATPAGPTGYGRQPLPIPANQSLVGKVLWLQSFLLPSSGLAEATPPHRITLARP